MSSEYANQSIMSGWDVTAEVLTVRVNGWPMVARVIFVLWMCSLFDRVALHANFGFFHVANRDIAVFVCAKSVRECLSGFFYHSLGLGWARDGIVT